MYASHHEDDTIPKAVQILLQILVIVHVAGVVQRRWLKFFPEILWEELLAVKFPLMEMIERQLFRPDDEITVVDEKVLVLVAEDGLRSEKMGGVIFLLEQLEGFADLVDDKPD